MARINISPYFVKCTTEARHAEDLYSKYIKIHFNSKCIRQPSKNITTDTQSSLQIYQTLYQPIKENLPVISKF